MKRASANWYNMPKRGLELRGFKESIADPCVFVFKNQNKHTEPVTLKGQTFKPISLDGKKTLQPEGSSVHVIKDLAQIKSKAHLEPIKASLDSIRDFKLTASAVIVLVYVDNCIILSPNQLSIQKFTDSLLHGPEKFAFTDEGSIDKYLGVNIEQLSNKAGFKMLQPHLIQRIIEAANIDLKFTNSCPTPAVNPLLSRDEQGPDRKHDRKYRTLTRMLGYLQLTLQPDCSMATHQCASFNANPKLCHERAV